MIIHNSATFVSYTITISELEGSEVSTLSETSKEFLSLKDAIAYGERRVDMILKTPFFPEGKPIFLNIMEEGNSVCPSFHIGRYGTPEDAPIVLVRA